jgi:phage terminase large subunit
MSRVVNIEFDAASVMNAAYIPYLDEMSGTQIFYGGSSSGKSVFLAQRDVLDVMGGGRNFLICRQVARTLRGSVFTEVCKVIADWGVGSLFTINKSDMVITCENGYQLIFVGLDDVEKLKSITPAQGVITDVRIEEATEIEYDSLKQLEKRLRGGDERTPKRITLSFNPIIQQHWIFDTFFKTISWADSQTEYKSSDLSILKTWYIHNRFLTAEDVRKLENEKDEYYRSVYTFGNWGVLGDVIFKNWHIQDLSAIHNQFTNPRNGLDFGFSSDPAALVCSHYDRARSTIYIYDEYYERGVLNNALAAEVKQRIQNHPVTCDSAEPKSIAELQAAGIAAYPAAKGKDSVNYGIQWIQQQTIIVDASCVNTINELRQYHWRKDKDGNSIRQPVDKNNHAIDALRYAYESDMSEPEETSQVIIYDDPVIISEY